MIALFLRNCPEVTRFIPMPTYPELINQLGAQLGIEELTPDEDGLCLLELAGELFVEIDHDPGTNFLSLSSEVGRIPDALAPAWYPNLLEANAFWIGTGGATLGLHQATGSVILAYREPLRGLTAEYLSGLFDDFVTTAQIWKGRILEEPNQQGHPQTREKIPPGGLRV